MWVLYTWVVTIAGKGLGGRWYKPSICPSYSMSKRNWLHFCDRIILPYLTGESHTHLDHGRTQLNYSEINFLCNHNVGGIAIISGIILRNTRTNQLSPVSIVKDRTSHKCINHWTHQKKKQNGSNRGHGPSIHMFRNSLNHLITVYVLTLHHSFLIQSWRIWLHQHEQASLTPFSPQIHTVKAGKSQFISRQRPFPTKDWPNPPRISVSKIRTLFSLLLHSGHVHHCKAKKPKCLGWTPRCQWCQVRHDQTCRFSKLCWLVVEPTHLKNIRQNGNLPQIEVKMKNVWNHHLVWHWI